ncbi:MAG: hypothetical protein HUK19_00555 [Fibrobacter sp.]|nr:hypothetical protein [Fibrobacter sp.]
MKNPIIKKPFFKIVVFSLLAVVAVALVFGGCTVYRKITAADILSKTRLDFNSVVLDSVSINKDLFPQKGGSDRFLPNPQVIAMVQDFAKGILEKEVGKASLTVGLTALNQSQDTLWIKKLNAMIDVDSLMTLPVELKDSVILIPGESKIELVTQMPLDRRLFKLKDIGFFNFKGRLEASLKKSDMLVPFEFNLHRTVSQQEKQELAEKARTSVLNGIVNDWVGAIFPNP